jgi:hypothetical protein
MWSDSSISSDTEFGTTKRASSWQHNSGEVIFKILDKKRLNKKSALGLLITRLTCSKAVEDVEVAYWS